MGADAAIAETVNVPSLPNNRLGLARVGLALLPWLPASVVCLFWVRYFRTEGAIAEDVQVLNAADSVAAAAGHSFWEDHLLTFVLIVTAFAFALGLTLIAFDFVRRQRFSNSPRARAR